MAQQILKGKFRVCVAKTTTFGDLLNDFHDVIHDDSDTSTTYYDDQFYKVYTAPNQTAVLAQCLADLGTERRNELAQLLSGASKDVLAASPKEFRI
jgi:hypothetical protein